MNQITIDKAMIDRKLLGAAFGDLSSWEVWRVALKAAYALPLTTAERESFRRIAGGRNPPIRKVKTLVVVGARRSGKGRIAGALATYESALVDHSAHLAPGETALSAIISPTRPQSRVVRDYTLGFFEQSPVLRGEIFETTVDQIKLRNGNVIATLAADYRTLRGRTLVFACIDECAFLRDELSASPDVECYRALLPALMTTTGLVAITSTPYRRNGLVHTLHRDHYNKDSEDVLVLQAGALVFNPTLDASQIAAARKADPQAALSEWDGEFRNDLSSFLDDASIEAAIDRARPLELPPREGIKYHAFADMSGGRHDASTICIAHAEGVGDARRFVADVVRGRKGNPNESTREFSALAREYRCRVITADNYAADWPVNAYAAEGVRLMRSKLTRSELYLEALPLFTREQVSIPDHPVTLRELRLLERRTGRNGADRVDHGPTGSDDYSNSLCAALVLAANVQRRPTIGFGKILYSGQTQWVSREFSRGPNRNNTATENWLAQNREKPQ